MPDKKLIIILLLSILHSFTSCWEIQRQQMWDEDSIYTLNQEQYWFTQIIDHFNYQNSNTWQQRYFVYSDYFNPLTGPVILYICGEAECRGISDQSFTAKLAQQTHGLVLSLEHRYYGKSLPFGVNSLSLPNLKYLSAGQALKDLAYFITKMSKSGQYKITPKNPWITVGGSYPGALSAWFRNKYPHLTVGALSSSGVVLAIEDFRLYDEQIYLSTIKSGQFCVDAILEVNKYVQTQVTSENKENFKAQFKATELTARQFLFYWSDVAASQVQYGNRTHFCNSLKGKTLEEQFALIKSLALKINPVDYGAVFLRNQTFAMADGRGMRSWIYQSCTQFSYFQTYAKDHPMRSRMITIDFYRKWCDDIFGQNMWPFVNRVNIEQGGLQLHANNLMMTNGDEDPWQWASLQKSKKPDIYTKIITCDDCAHCVDLHSPNKNDAKDLTNTRTYEEETIKKWIAEHWKNIK